MNTRPITLLITILSLSPLTLMAGNQFRPTIELIEELPYNPRPVATDTLDVTGVSEGDSRTVFLGNFERVEIPAPANGKTFKSSDPSNVDDITLVGYLYVQKESGIPRADLPGIILTHGGAGNGSIATQRNYLIHIANVLADNGYHVLAVDRRDGLLTRCAYEVGTLNPDPARSQPWDSNNPPAEHCQRVPNGFRDPSFEPNSLETGYTVFGAGDILAAALYLVDETGTSVIGAHGGSRGGFGVIRAAAIQDDPDTDFASTPELLDAILAFSPIGDRDTRDLSSSSNNFSCRIVTSAQRYSEINGAGIRDFDVDPVGATEDMYALINGVTKIKEVEVPTLIIHVLSDSTIFVDMALAYQSKTSGMPHAHTLFIARTGHFADIWQSDPYWVDSVVLTYFKQFLASDKLDIGDIPGFPSLGPNLDNPLLVHPKLSASEGKSLLAEEPESIVPYLVGDNGACYDTTP